MTRFSVVGLFVMGFGSWGKWWLVNVAGDCGGVYGFVLGSFGGEGSGVSGMEFDLW